jgi:hypothetical protein
LILQALMKNYYLSNLELSPAFKTGQQIAAIPITRIGISISEPKH